MITRFKLFENIGVSWVSPDIRKILADYDMDVNFTNMDNSQLVYRNNRILINSTDLEYFLKAINKAEKKFNIPKSKITELKDRVCEYIIKFIYTPRLDPDNLKKILDNMSDELLRKLEDDKRLGKMAIDELVKRSANKYNL